MIGVLKTSLTSLLLVLAPIPALAEDADPERRLNRVTVTTLAPDTGQLNVNPVVIRPQDFERPGFAKVNLDFTPIYVLEPDLYGETSAFDQKPFRITTTLPHRPSGIPFEDTARSYSTKSVLLKKGRYVLTRLTFEPDISSDQAPLIYCFADGTLAFDVLGRDIMYLPSFTIAYPTATEGELPSPMIGLETSKDLPTGWRSQINHFEVFRTSSIEFDRDSDVCRDATVIRSIFSASLEY